MKLSSITFTQEAGDIIDLLPLILGIISYNIFDTQDSVNSRWLNFIFFKVTIRFVCIFVIECLTVKEGMPN